MDRKVLIAALLVSAAINLVAVFTFGFYWREGTRHRQHFPPPPGFGNRGQNLDRLKERLKLTDAQMDTIRKIDEDVKTRMRSLSQSVFEKLTGTHDIDERVECGPQSDRQPVSGNRRPAG